ncbi:MAG: DUF3086 domain-containing protein [Cyanobacteria bacterium J06623_5]
MPPEDFTPYDAGSYESTDADRAIDAPSSAASRPSEAVPSEAGPSGAGPSDAGLSGADGDRTEARPPSPPSSPPLGLRRADHSRGGRLQSASTSTVQADVAQLVQQGLSSLEGQRRNLQREIEQLERRKARLEAEMTSSFAGSSQDIAIRVQGFKDYLVGSLQDLATAAEQINLVPQATVDPPAIESPAPVSAPAEADAVSLAAGRFAEQRDRIHSLLDQYRTRPDYYGPPWQLRRTFEPIHADRVSNWFFTQGSRGAVKSMGSRLQNVLIASAAISCLYAIYDRRLCVLVLATTPERLGEWRRWLQDCLGIARADFGTNRGVMLFESSEPMAQRAERLLDSGRLPFLIMDEAEEKVSLSLLQYPLLLGFAPDPANPSTDYDYY